MLLVQVVVGGLLLGAIYALFSSGLTLIWGMMNFINFAHGEFVMLGMYVSLLVVLSVGGGLESFGLAAAFALFVLGVIIYLSLIRHVMRGPMLAQILSTFGLALLLRYTAFWIFSANFVSLPQTPFSGTLNLGGIGRNSSPASRQSSSPSACISCSRAPPSAAAFSPSPKIAMPPC
jgi:branched-chain amino acid transport system permease protein